MRILGLLTLGLAGVMAALCVTGTLITRSIETEADPHALAPGTPGTSFLSTSSGETHVLDVGDGEVILLIHGSTGSIAEWQEHVVDPLAESHRVVAFDSYGFGFSERNESCDYGYDMWARQAIEVLDALEIERAVVLGHSAGALTAVKLAANHPERVRGAILTGHGLTVDPAQMVPLLPGIGEFWAAQQSVIGDVFSESHRQQAEAAHRIRGTRAAYLAFLRSQYSLAFLRDYMFSSIYGDIEIPVLQMHGTMDQSQAIASARKLSSRLTNTRFVAIEGSGHFIHIDAPERWVEEVARFVATVPR